MSELKKCCGNCARFAPDPKRPGHGWCDEWPCELTADCVCHPYVGRPKERKERGKNDWQDETA